ncbi:trimeric intracellular cation channel family protein [Biformimicrobium ophioploci]|uniref:Trimeric intracellular cation channel family protein n=1 Tax=Biformimicrobium ophioploci TaxID=3036711 RepID=A0ABQ6M1I6_9GAMM|nr:trimeric intracellular cation channel family protein [Microbulbifer sp. NKW57]GMG88130.1 trimeric intracellular cation channel family protein [Microbulbifer sp. NKW57]
MDALIFWSDLVGTAVFAFSGVLAAGHKRMDLFGAVVLACVTATGGGTIRDILLDAPVFWVHNNIYLWISGITALVSFYLIRYFNIPRRVLAIADAMGLAVFVVIGAEKALSLGASPLIAVVMGMVTATFGGLIRDLLSGEIPLLLRREIYATAALLGAAVMVWLDLYTSVPGPIIVALAMAVTLSIRLAAMRWDLSAPTARFGHNRDN